MTDIRLSSFLEYKHFSNSNNTDGLVSKYEVNTFNLGLSLKQLNSVLAGGQSNVAFNFDDGDTNYGGSPNQASQSQQDTGGHFNRLRANVVHTQFMQDDLSVVLKANGQWSDVNLDSSQKFYLGGASGVRAYPVNEGAGSNGFVVNAEIRKKLPFNVSVTGFYDYGYARQYVNDPSITGGSITGPNNFNLQGYGLSLDWLGPYRSFFSVSAAQRLGHNPNAIGGNDSDGTSPGTFYWFQTQISF
jgi:hemolysin activation/secretion protein